MPRADAVHSEWSGGWSVFASLVSYPLMLTVFGGCR